MKKEFKWIDPILIIGNVATGKYYFNRIDIENEIVIEILKGNHILLSAPRRVGKTSIVRYLEQKKLIDANCIFENIQEIRSEISFYKRIYELIFSSLKKNQQIFKEIKHFFSGRGLKSISIEGEVAFKDKKEPDYNKEINILIKKLEENKTKVILFIDELPDVLHYLHETIDKPEEAIGIIKSIRTWRQNFKENHLIIVWTGSVGLRHIVEKITGRVDGINDLKEIKFKPFTNKEALTYIKHVTKNATIRYTKEKAQYLLDKIEYPIPYFINIMLDEINKTSKSTNTKTINKATIDFAFNSQIENNENFEDWLSRLFMYYKKSNALFMNEVLIFIAHNSKISEREIYNLAIKHNKQLNWKKLINNLSKDGYIVKKEDYYFFVSPFLRGFWLKNNPFYEN